MKYDLMFVDYFYKKKHKIEKIKQRTLLNWKEALPWHDNPQRKNKGSYEDTKNLSICLEIQSSTPMA